MIPLLIPVPALLLLWGATLLVRGLAAGAASVAARRAKLNTRRLVILPATRGQILAGLIGGPGAMCLGVCLFAFGIYWADQWGQVEAFFRYGSERWVGAGVAVVVGLATTYVGVRFDPAKKRRRCARCWYDFSSLADTGACPECGRVAEGAHDLARTRRSRGLILLGLCITLSSYIILVSARVASQGVKGLAPTTLLIAGAGWLPDWLIFESPPARPGGDGSLISRVSAREGMQQWQYLWIRRRAARLVANAKTVEEARRAVEISMRVGVQPGSDGTPSDQLLDRALDGLESADAAQMQASLVIFRYASMGEDAALDRYLASRADRVRAIIAKGDSGADALLGFACARARLATPWMELIEERAAKAGKTMQLQFLASCAADVSRRVTGVRNALERLMLKGADEKVRMMAIYALAQADQPRGGWSRPTPYLRDALGLALDDPSDAVAAVAIEAGVLRSRAYGMQIDDWAPLVMRFLKERAQHRGPAIAAAAALTGRHPEVGVWVLRDQREPAAASDGSVVQALTTARASEKWREMLNGALAEARIDPAHQAAIRKELARLDGAPAAPR